MTQQHRREKQPHRPPPPPPPQQQQPPLAAHRRAERLGIPGLALLPSFVTEQEEELILERLDGDGDEAWQSLARRRARHYGAAFDYATRGVVGGSGSGGGGGGGGGPQQQQQQQPETQQLPEWAVDLARRVEQALRDRGLLEGLGAEATPTGGGGGEHDTAPAPTPTTTSSFFNQITANEYSPGVGLAPHVDTHSAFEGPILSLSLGGPCVVELRRYGVERREEQQGGERGEAPPVSPRVSRQGRPGALALPTRSLLVLSGEARLGWHHYIPHRKADPVWPGDKEEEEGEGHGGDSGSNNNPELVPRAPRRVSLTLRRVRPPGAPPCRCAWPSCCDDQGGGMPPTRAQEREKEQGQQQQQRARASDDGNNDPNDRHAAELERRHVHQVYDAISDHFDSTRFAVWPAVVRFLSSLPAGAIVADVGCGNGKYFAVRRDLAVLGSDRSERLAEAAARRAVVVEDEDGGGGGRGEEEQAPPHSPPQHSPAPLPPPPPGADALVADALALPYAPGRCDAVLSIAVLHHLSTPHRRRRAIAEMARALRVGGRGLVTVWALEQDKPARTLARWRPVTVVEGKEEEEGEGGGGEGDYLVPWHLPLPAKKKGGGGEVAAEAAAAAGGPSAPGAPPLPALAGVPADLAAPRVDPSKRSVVYGRYYHLFARGELERLVEEAVGGGEGGEGGGGGGEGQANASSSSSRSRPRCVVVESLFDKSNWCVTFERVE
jgi:alkylated DNA repair protein alkB family protein 8